MIGDTRRSRTRLVEREQFRQVERLLTVYAYNPIRQSNSFSRLLNFVQGHFLLRSQFSWLGWYTMASVIPFPWAEARRGIFGVKKRQDESDNKRRSYRTQLQSMLEKNVSLGRN